MADRPDFGWWEEMIASSLWQDSGSDNYTAFIYRISWSPSGRKLAVYRNTYSEHPNDGFDIVGVDHPGKVLASISGSDPMFWMEGMVLYCDYDDGVGSIYSYSLKTGKTEKVIPDAEQPG
ncbi:MAG: hypothetical protein P4L46_04800 [Fimbriimonas sp.]|nr:hypothetical protein [Fimbriimonas sp.]